MTQMLLEGSCLCGQVKYLIKGRPERFYHCHCKRCRKSTGTGHASNIMVAEAELTWPQGESLLQRFKVPDAERFTRQFCSHCGSLVPRYVPELKMVIIPAGSLDTDPGIAPQSRIFWDSRAAWSCSGDELPVFPEYPK